MKSFMITATIVAMVALCAACQSEPEVGDALYPQTEETYGPHAYINETAAPGNAACLQLVQTPVELLLPDQNVSFKVRLTQPAETDVTVNLAEILRPRGSTTLKRLRCQREPLPSALRS
ncbi:MAG: hypothetical protein ACI4UC_07510 [Alloprevotella sp.]